MLTDTGSHLEGMPVLAMVSVVIGLTGVPLAFALERRLRHRLM
jgi:hypothetical protein